MNFISLVELAKIEFKFDEYEFYFITNVNIFMFSNLTTMTSYSSAIKNTKTLNKLYEWHFDVNNLINENKAIGI